MRIARAGELFLTVDLGEMVVTMLSDGETTLPGRFLLGAEIAGEIPIPVRAFLVRGPEGCLLIDAGAADQWQPGLGRLPEAMAEAGIAAGEVTALALTHSHADHVSGLVDDDGGLAFPNADRLFVAVEDLMAVRANPRLRPLHPRLMPLEQGDGPIRGVTAVNAPGHTAGHMAYLVEGRLLIWGDLVHHAETQFPRPEITWHHDVDRDLARSSRLQLMEQAVEAGWLVAGAHLPAPGIGRIERSGAGYTFHPITRG